MRTRQDIINEITALQAELLDRSAGLTTQDDPATATNIPIRCSMNLDRPVFQIDTESGERWIHGPIKMELELVTWDRADDHVNVWQVKAVVQDGSRIVRRAVWPADEQWLRRIGARR